MNTESLNIIKGIVDCDKLLQAKVISQENIALGTTNASLSKRNKNLKKVINTSIALAAIYGVYHLYKKHKNDKN